MNKYFKRREHCPNCGGSKTFELCSAPYTVPPLRDYLISFYSKQGKVEFDYLCEQSYVLTECGDCSLVYQAEIPNEFLMQKLYEEWIDPGYALARRRKGGAVTYQVQLVQQIASVLRYLDRCPTELQLLDFGMGWGEWCRAALAFGCAVHGTEISAARIQHAQQYGVRIVPDNVLPSHKYDFVNAEQIFEHLPDPQRTLAVLSQCLNKGGVLRIAVPDGTGIKRRLREWNWMAPKGHRHSLNAVTPLEHINCFNRKSLLHLARQFNLAPVRVPLYANRSEAVGKILGCLRRGISAPGEFRSCLFGERTCMFFSSI